MNQSQRGFTLGLHKETVQENQMSQRYPATMTITIATVSEYAAMRGLSLETQTLRLANGWKTGSLEAVLAREEVSAGSGKSQTRHFHLNTPLLPQNFL